MKSIEAEVEIIGLPFLKARESVSIENIGSKFSGAWRISKIRHEISESGYICNLTLCRNDHNKSASNNKNKSTPKKKASSKNNNAKTVNNSSTSATSATSNKKPPKIKVDLS